MTVTSLTVGDGTGQRIAQRLEDAVGNRKYHLWFESAQLDCRDGALEVSVPNQFTAQWIGAHFDEALCAAAEAELGRPVQLRLKIDRDLSPQPASAPQEAPSQPNVAVTTPNALPAASTNRPRQRLRYDLAEFIVGPSNELAYSAACRLVDEAARELNPLFIHGGCGLGKTHLLQGLCRRFADTQPDGRWRYTTTEQFTNQYVQAVRTNRLASFRRALRTLELLVIDDVHLITDKHPTQKELLHTFDAVDLQGARLVMASDRTPKQITHLTDALSSRFMRGMVVRIDNPDPTTQHRIIEAIAQRRGMALTDSVAQALAKRRCASVREIEGMLTHLSALAALDDPTSSPGQPIGHVLLNRLLRADNPSGAPRPIEVQTILHTVCEHLGVESRRVLGKWRHRRVVLARSLTAYLARELTSFSYPELAKALGRDHHSTMIAAVQRIEDQVQRRAAPPVGPGLDPTTMDQLVEHLRSLVIEASNNNRRAQA